MITIINDRVLTKRLMHLFLPILATSFSATMVGVFATMMVASISMDELAASALAISTYIMICVFFYGIFCVISILISHARGSEKVDSITKIVQNGLMIAIISGFILGAIFDFIPELLLLLHQDPPLIKLASRFFYFIDFGIIQIFCVSILNHFFWGLGKPKISLVFTLLQTLATIILSYFLILGKGGFPQLNLGGFACSISIVATFQLAILIIYIQLSPSLRKYHIFSTRIKFDISTMNKILFQGFPVGLLFSAEIIAYTLSTYMMGWLGDSDLASLQIVNQVIIISFIIITSLTQATTIMISYAFGENDLSLVLKVYYIARALGLSLMLLIGLVVCLKPNWIMEWFIDINSPQNIAIIHLTKALLLIAVITQLIDIVRNILNSTLRSIKDTKAPMIINVVSIWLIGLPLSYALGFIWNFGAIGLRIGFIFAFLISTIFLDFRLKRLVH